MPRTVAALETPGQCGHRSTRQRAGPEHDGQILGLLLGAAAGDDAPALGDLALDRRRRVDGLVEDDGHALADIGAGNGYYTVRLAERVGDDGRVLAQDIDREALSRLGRRIERQRLENVSIRLGEMADPKLPDGSFDRIFMVHMYHEIESPYEFLWRMWPSLREDGQVIVVDVDRPTDRHGIPPKLLFCEFDQVGLKLVEFVERPDFRGYFARFERGGARAEPAAIEACPNI